MIPQSVSRVTLYGERAIDTVLIPSDDPPNLLVQYEYTYSYPDRHDGLPISWFDHSRIGTSTPACSSSLRVLVLVLVAHVGHVGPWSRRRNRLALETVQYLPRPAQNPRYRQQSSTRTVSSIACTFTDRWPIARSRCKRQNLAPLLAAIYFLYWYLMSSMGVANVGTSTHAVLISERLSLPPEGGIRETLSGTSVSTGKTSYRYLEREPVARVQR